jgi:ABC-type branched-subunit amino acid transport system ATPase component
MQTFKVTDYKGVRHIELSPSGRLVLIAGGNGAGKSSFIDAIAELFDPKGTKLTPKPIREGADEARAEYVDDELGLRIIRTWKKNGTAGALQVEALDGARYSRPSDVVAELTGGAIFDPVAFLNLDEKKQRDILLEKVTLPFDLDAIAREKLAAEQRRLEAGREVKRLQGALSSLQKPPAGYSTEEVSAADIIQQISQAEASNGARDLARRQYDDAANAVADFDRQIEELKRRREEAADRQERAWRTLKIQPEPIDVEPLREQLRTIEDTNRARRQAREYGKLAAELSDYTSAQKAAQAELDRIEQDKRAGLAAAEFPVPGLSVTDEGVTFNGIPFGQVNSAERRKIAFAIATAGDPKLRLVIIRDGDLLDADSLQAIAGLADERGYTVLMERDRDESRLIGFTIRDGALAEEVPA